MSEPRADWQAISVDWHNFQLSIADIARRHEISETAVRKGGRKRVERGEWAVRPSHSRGRKPAGAPDLASTIPMPVAGEAAVYYPRFNASGRELPPVGLMPTSVEKRPTIYTKKIGERICDLIGQGWTLEQVCMLPDMPALWRISQWTRSDDHKDFSRAYWAAREAQLQLEMDDLDAEMKLALTAAKNEAGETASGTKKVGGKSAKTVTTQWIQALRERRQHLEFKLANLLPHIFRGTGRKTGKNADDVENKGKVTGLAAAARKGTSELLDRGVIDPNTRQVTLKVVEGGRKK